MDISFAINDKDRIALMEKKLIILFTFLLITSSSGKLFSQSGPISQELGLNVGALTNFPANQDYLTKNMSVFYVAPYIRVGQHEFSAGFMYPLSTQGLYFSDDKIHPRLGAMAGYKFYIFDIYGRENLFIHYTFQYLRFKGNFDPYNSWSNEPYQLTETDMYINNVIGFGYNLFFDADERFGLYYTLDYVISQASYRLNGQGLDESPWGTRYIWNNLSTNFGLVFKLTSLKKKKQAAR